MKKNFFLTAVPVLLSLSVILSACSHSSNKSSTWIQPDKKVSLSFIFASGDSITNQATNNMVESFNKSHPNIQIIQIPSTPADTYDNYLKTKIAVGEFPDFLEIRDAQIYADAGKISTLPQEIVDLLDNPATVNGKVYTAPMYASALLGIIYNKDIFAKAGIIQQPKTWDEFLADCEKIKGLGISPIVVGGKDIWHMSFWQSFFFGNYLYADNPNWNEDRKSGKVHYTDANVMDAMHDMTELWTKGYIDKAWLSTADNQVTSILISGKASMLYAGSWMFNTIKQADPKFNIGFFAPPDRNGRTVTLGKPTPQGYSLSAEAAKDPDKVAAFIEFMKFFYNTDNYSKFLQVTNGIAATKAKIMYDAPEEMQKLLSIYNDPQTIKVLSMDNYWGENKVPTEFRDWLWKLSQQWLSSDIPNIEQAMKQADAEFDKDIKNNK
jgi:raffinose/stachyose/melibiose transport system substrate-binding protein